ncbi:LysE family translocator [uncultured Jannaschia sp.]|uniref:LysE family translocator n=1 Tax=uncultured Jannaschia sp. TaxID=293347 RepID=UPI002631A128|nr:LysE family translocator [uncultured Jannaschia sp.]
MPPLDSVLAVIAAGFALSVTPGPSMLYVLSRSVGQGRAAGFASAIGLCLGGMLLAVATALGLAALFSLFGWLVTVLRIAGSVYLAWLGIGMILEARTNARKDLHTRTVTDRSFFDIVRQGVWVELLNPKTVLFFALFLPPFIDPNLSGSGGGSIRMQMFVLGILVPLTAIPSDLVVAWMGGKMSRTLDRHRRLREVMAWIGGGVLVAIAIDLQLGWAFG